MSKKGISIVEIIIAVSITLIIAGISISVFSRLSNSTSLDRDANIVLSYITKARTKAIDSVNSSSHGVGFGNGYIRVFEGTELTSSNISESYDLKGGSHISSINLSNGTSSLYFNKLTGSPSATGDIVMSSRDESKTIVIYATGIAEIQ